MRNIGFFWQWNEKSYAYELNAAGRAYHFWFNRQPRKLVKLIGEAQVVKVTSN